MISNSGHDERNRYSGGTAGDQTGGEWAIINWYNRPWNYVLRHPNPDVRELLAEVSEAAARNNCIGYDQNQRTTYWTQLKAAGYDPSKIKTKCEADCSAGVAANVKAVGYLLNISALKNVSKDCYTGNLRAALKTAGFEVLTASKYLTSDQYLLRGDILLYEYHHTAVNLTNGSKSGKANSGSSSNKVTPSSGTASCSENVGKGQKWLNSNYGNLIKEECGALLVVDKDYGPKCRAAALCVWKDLMNRKHGFKLTPSNTNFGDSCKKAAKKAVIREGDSGTLVYITQFILAGMGLYSGKMDADFGRGTKTGVKALQRMAGIKEDGIVGVDTWYVLFNH